MSLKVKKVKGPYLFTVDMFGSKGSWEELDDDDRSVYWRAFWRHMEQVGSLLTYTMFNRPGESGESTKKGSLPESTVVAMWTRNQSSQGDKEDKAIAAANVAGWRALESEGRLPIGFSFDGSHDKPALEKPPIIGIEPQDPSAIELVVGGLDAAKDAIVDKAKDTVQQVKNAVPQVSFGAGVVVAIVGVIGFVWLTRR